MTKVLTRNNCNANFWKEKFISGLPVLFAERVKNRLKSKYPTHFIDWSILTYGDLSAEITVEGITICNDIKLKRQLDMQKEKNRNIIGDFCEQIGFQQIQYPKKDKKRKRFPFKKKKHYLKDKEKTKKYSKEKV